MVSRDLRFDAKTFDYVDESYVYFRDKNGLYASYDLDLTKLNIDIHTYTDF